MDSKIALDKIKETEHKAQEIIEEAKKEAKKILREADLEKERIIKESKTQAKLDAQKLKDRARRDVQKEISLIESQTEEKGKSIKEKAKGNFDRALDFIKSKLK